MTLSVNTYRRGNSAVGVKILLVDMNTMSLPRIAPWEVLGPWTSLAQGYFYLRGKKNLSYLRGYIC
jgi:hypothetical protein